MVTMNQGIREVRENSSRLIHLMEAGLMSAFEWISGPAMSEQDRVQLKLAETQPLRRFPQPPL